MGRNYTVVCFSDNLRVAVAAIVALISFSSPAFAGFDLAVDGIARSYPLSGTVGLAGGYNFLLWGTPGRGSPWYGYLRPNLNGSTAITYNSLGASLEVFPLSFFGARAGGEAIQNDANYTAYDCANFGCRGRFARAFVEGELTLGAGRFFAQFKARRERWTEREAPNHSFIEPTSGLALSGLGDAQSVYRLSAGAKLSDMWSLAAVLEYTESSTLRGVSRFPFALVRYSDQTFSAGLGVGTFTSTLKGEGVSVLGFLRWDVVPSLALN